jgi:hypothetical protein
MNAAFLLKNGKIMTTDIDRRLPSGMGWKSSGMTAFGWGTITVGGQ